MPTKRERDYYRMGYQDGYAHATHRSGGEYGLIDVDTQLKISEKATRRNRPKRKLSAWNKFVKANSRKKEFRYRDGKLNLKKMGVAFRRKKRR